MQDTALGLLAPMSSGLVGAGDRPHGSWGPPYMHWEESGAQVARPLGEGWGQMVPCCRDDVVM